MPHVSCFAFMAAQHKQNKPVGSPEWRVMPVYKKKPCYKANVS